MEMISFRQSEIGPIKTILIKHAKDAFLSDLSIRGQWKPLNYKGRPDFKRAVKEYNRFVSLLEAFQIACHYLPPNENVGLDSIYTRDASMVCKKGMILCNVSKPARQAEPRAQASVFRELKIPIHGAIRGQGRIEGGDVLWLNEETIAVAQGYRTNAEGIRQLRVLLKDCIKEFVVVPLPHWQGPDDVFHLMSIISPVDRDLAVVYSPLMPVPFRDKLCALGMNLVEVPDSEFETMGCNVLTLAPRRCIMLAGNPVTRRRLQNAGVEVHVFKGEEICFKGAGGPTCLTRPLARG
jgi:N-dimethylarginine dimethylaminohydrolase